MAPLADLLPLFDLLQERTVLLLGAGASMDYGFPSWNHLKNDLLQIFSDESWPEISGHEGAAWWRDAILTMKDDETIDAVATNAPGEYFDLFRIATAVVITRYEERDKSNSNPGWIEMLAEKYLVVLRNAYPNDVLTKKLGSNLSVITLNYDRLFDIRFYPKLKNGFCEMLAKPREFQKKYAGTGGIFSDLSRVLHVHGAVGSTPGDGSNAEHHTYLNPSIGLQVPYGGTQRLQTMVRKGAVPFIAPVDDLVDAKNPTYDKANNLLRKARYCICIGLSPLGLTESHLDLLNVEKVFYSGREEVFPNFEAVNLRAGPFIDRL